MITKMPKGANILNAMVSGRSRGVYVAVCKTEVMASSLTAEESGPCRACRRWSAGQ